MKFTETELHGVYTIEPEIFQDQRGEFFRIYDREGFLKIGFNGEFVQVNRSINKTKATLRGMHYQQKPYDEVKLIQCTRGKIFDVIVDLRKDSATFLKWISLELSEENKLMVFIPGGFAHGFQTLEDDSQLLYFHSTPYSPGHEGAIHYKDEKVGIRWRLPVSVISEKDNNHPVLDSNFKGI
jgi:dTDP-4-dehydrorhamnose 3,5-epimerase